MKKWIALLAVSANCAWPLGAAGQGSNQSVPVIRLLRLDRDASATLLIAGHQVTLRKGEASGPWTLVETLPGEPGSPAGYAVLEDYCRLNGALLMVKRDGRHVSLPKSSEPTSADPSKLYL